MMRHAWSLAALALVLTGGCTNRTQMEASREAEARSALADAIGDRVPGKPQDCISPGMADGPQIIDENTVLYRAGGRLYRAELAATCPGLAPLNTMVVEMRGAQLCRNDQFRVLQAGTSIPGPYCRFGKFIPYERRKGN